MRFILCWLGRHHWAMRQQWYGVRIMTCHRCHKDRHEIVFDPTFYVGVDLATGVDEVHVHHSRALYDAMTSEARR